MPWKIAERRKPSHVLVAADNTGQERTLEITAQQIILLTMVHTQIDIRLNSGKMLGRYAPRWVGKSVRTPVLNVRE